MDIHRNTHAINRRLKIANKHRYMNMFKNPFGLDGRIGRIEYLLSVAIYFGVDITNNLVMVFAGTKAFSIALIPCLILSVAQGAKRCHDIGKSGWWQLIPFFILWLFVAKGDEGENEYGEVPV